MGDASAMLILAGIDLGVAEVAGRGRRLFALPALVAGLALPLVSVGLALRGGLIGDESLFVLFAAGTFYAATCGRLRWKGLGYAAAVLYNAALWVLWARFGWKLAEAPQFYLVPVGFSTILFAEANVRELGRSRVNAIRGVGLTLIYLALAVPIWQTASLAAWAAVLGVSLVGDLRRDRPPLAGVPLARAGRVRARRRYSSSAGSAWSTRWPSGRSCSSWASRWSSSWP